jgi:hypothetical protein
MMISTSIYHELIFHEKPPDCSRGFVKGLDLHNDVGVMFFVDHVDGIYETHGT